MIIGGSGSNAAGYGGYVAQSITTNANTHAGDLVIIVAYVEPANERENNATYGALTIPVGVSLVPGFPINTDDAQITTGDDHRLYVWYYYATADGAQVLNFGDSVDVYWGLACVTIRGGPTADSPLADPAATATISRDASSATTSPPVSLNLAHGESLVLWVYGDWDGNNTGSPTGFNNAAHAPNEAGQPAISVKTFSAAGNTGVIDAPRNGTDDGMTAGLLSFRAP